ncbi:MULTISPECIES: hypothetical protein [Rhizobium]|jgi:hypothetical protein|uniref:Uncharacterized protein n=1 Tax=Rhizobium laguerreae TaxID=1076926 RepID=A0A1S9H4B0_9HYPH|nr:hypothetical protein [Rhizobium laguerreae]OOO52931.1 hypothetical protein BS630_01745 [Rhizobium laguerreae]TCU27239.1 hypothetical protein EV131_103270 [Rhizobium laguerreae]
MKILVIGAAGMAGRKLVAAPGNSDASRAQALGFGAETSFDEIIHVPIEDELEGRLPELS